MDFTSDGASLPTAMGGAMYFTSDGAAAAVFGFLVMVSCVAAGASAS